MIYCAEPYIDDYLDIFYRHAYDAISRHAEVPAEVWLEKLPLYRSIGAAMPRRDYQATMIGRMAAADIATSPFHAKANISHAYITRVVFALEHDAVLYDTYICRHR